MCIAMATMACGSVERPDAVGEPEAKPRGPDPHGLQAWINAETESHYRQKSHSHLREIRLPPGGFSLADAEGALSRFARRGAEGYEEIVQEVALELFDLEVQEALDEDVAWAMMPYYFAYSVEEFEALLDDAGDFAIYLEGEEPVETSLTGSGSPENLDSFNESFKVDSQMLEHVIETCNRVMGPYRTQ
jgi:hypothetical protein